MSPKFSNKNINYKALTHILSEDLLERKIPIVAVDVFEGELEKTRRKILIVKIDVKGSTEMFDSEFEELFHQWKNEGLKTKTYQSKIITRHEFFIIKN